MNTLKAGCELYQIYFDIHKPLATFILIWV